MAANADTMNDIIIEHNTVVRYMIKLLEPNYVILTNIDGEKNFLSGIFPDIILLDKVTKQPVFIIEVRRNGQIQSCLQQWKTISNLPATLYVIVPENDLSGAKLVATSIGLNTKFGVYTYNNNQVTSFKFE